MANWTSGILTNQGRDLQLKVEAGANLKITRFKLGDGMETAADAKDLHDLIGTKIAFGITGIERTGGLCKFTGIVTSSKVTAGFRAREWGLFAEDPDKGEILYMVSLDDRPDYITAQDAVLNSTFVYALNVDISQAAKIEAVVDPTGLVTAEMLQKAAGLLRRNTTYALKDTVSDIQLAGHPSWRLVCTKAGTTSGTLLNLLNAKLNDVYTDGTAEWTVKDAYTSVVEEHNTAPNAHENRFAEVANNLEDHNCDSVAHIELFDQVYSEITSHNSSSGAHTALFAQIRQSLTNHNAAPDAHADIRQLCENAGINLLCRNHAYTVGDIAYSKNLPSWARLECVQAGTTAASEPGGLAAAAAGTLVTDGGVRWIVDDVRDGTTVGTVRGSLYLPPGYIKANGAAGRLSTACYACQPL